MDKLMETLAKDTHFFINTEFGHHLPVIQLVSLVKLTLISSEYSLVEYCTNSSWRTSSSCLRDGRGGNLLFTLPSKTDHSVSMIFISGDFAGQGICRSASSCSSNQD